MEKFIQQLAQKHFNADRQAFINFIRKSFQLNGDEITDIYNEVWIDLIDNVRRGRTEKVKNWKSYVFNLGWKRACKLVTRRAEMERIDEEGGRLDFETGCLDDLEDDRLNLEHLERIETMMLELERLPEKQREMLTLFYLQGKSAAEVAEEMDYRSDRTVITLKRRSVAQLRERIQAVA